MIKGVLIYLITPLVSAFSQLLLKKAADDRSLTGIRFYLNGRVILAYGLLMLCMALNVVAQMWVGLTLVGVLEALSYVYVMLLSRRFLKEKITRRRLIGNLVIVLGVALTLLADFPKF